MPRAFSNSSRGRGRKGDLDVPLRIPSPATRLKNSNKGFTLTGQSVTEVLLFVLGFLLNNALLGLNLKICIDGQRSLQDAILSFFFGTLI